MSRFSVTSPSHPVAAQINQILRIHRKFQFSPKTKKKIAILLSMTQPFIWVKKNVGAIGTN